MPQSPIPIRPQGSDAVADSTVESGPASASASLPRPLVQAVIAVCVLPALLSWAGVDFSSHKQPLDTSLSGSALVDGMFHGLSGAFTHTLLEWSAFCIALFTVVLAVAHFMIKRDVVTPVIALALMAAGCMDAFHTLAADRLIEAQADNSNLVPFTWAICRLFNSLICMLGVGMFLFRRKEHWGHNATRLLAVSGVGFAIAAYVIIHLCATSSNLPQTQFPGAMITRPWDVGPFILFFLSSFLFVKFYQKHPSTFTYSLVLSTIPDLATQAHMALGSSALFDAHFNIAHFLKIVAYAVPCMGLIIDYIRIHQQELALIGQLEKTGQERESMIAKLEEAAARLSRSNDDLQQFAYIASHDLKAPLRGIRTLAEWIDEDLGDNKPGDVAEHLVEMARRTARLEGLIEGVLKYSRLDAGGHETTLVDTRALIKTVGEETLPIDGTFRLEVVGQLPSLQTSETLLSQVLSNLLSNAVAHHHRTTGKVTVGCVDRGGVPEFWVRDDGPGIAPEFHEKVFQIFQTLESRDRKESTGIGLSLVQKLVFNQGGEVRIQSDGKTGTTFYFTWPNATRGRNAA